MLQLALGENGRAPAVVQLPWTGSQNSELEKRGVT